MDIASGKIQDTIKFDSGNLCMVTGGRNTGRVGTIMSRERHPGSFDIVHVKDANGHTFATRINYVFIIGIIYGGIQKKINKILIVRTFNFLFLVYPSLLQNYIYLLTLFLFRQG